MFWNKGYHFGIASSTYQPFSESLFTPLKKKTSSFYLNFSFFHAMSSEFSSLLWLFFWLLSTLIHTIWYFLNSCFLIQKILMLFVMYRNDNLVWVYFKGNFIFFFFWLNGVTRNTFDSFFFWWRNMATRHFKSSLLYLYIALFFFLSFVLSFFTETALSDFRSTRPFSFFFFLVSLFSITWLMKAEINLVDVSQCKSLCLLPWEDQFFRANPLILGGQKTNILQTTPIHMS